MNFMRTSGPMHGACLRRWAPILVYSALPTPPETGPALVTAPQLNGLAIVGRSIGYTAGEFSASETITLSRQWVLDGADIDGETGATYTPIPTDVGKHLAMKEIASTGFGDDAVAWTMAAVVLAVPETAVPSSPTNVTAVAQAAGQILVSWTPPETAADGAPVGAITSLMIYHSATAGQARLGGTGALSVTVVPINNTWLLTNVDPGLRYVSVSAINAAGEGFESAEASATVT